MPAEPITRSTLPENPHSCVNEFRKASSPVLDALGNSDQDQPCSIFSVTQIGQRKKQSWSPMRHSRGFIVGAPTVTNVQRHEPRVDIEEAEPAAVSHESSILSGAEMPNVDAQGVIHISDDEPEIITISSDRLPLSSPSPPPQPQPPFSNPGLPVDRAHPLPALSQPPTPANIVAKSGSPIPSSPPHRESSSSLPRPAHLSETEICSHPGSSPPPIQRPSIHDLTPQQLRTELALIQEREMALWDAMLRQQDILDRLDDTEDQKFKEAGYKHAQLRNAMGLQGKRRGVLQELLDGLEGEE